LMHEVKVYDNSGKLKKVISIKALHIRSKKQLDTPALFLKNKKGRRSWSKSAKDQAKSETQ